MNIRSFRSIPWMIVLFVLTSFSSHAYADSLDDAISYRKYK